jgi:hypothetical protein
MIRVLTLLSVPMCLVLLAPKDTVSFSRWKSPSQTITKNPQRSLSAEEYGADSRLCTCCCAGHFSWSPGALVSLNVGRAPSHTVSRTAHTVTEKAQQSLTPEEYGGTSSGLTLLSVLMCRALLLVPGGTGSFSRRKSSSDTSWGEHRLKSGQPTSCFALLSRILSFSTTGL